MPTTTISTREAEPGRWTYCIRRPNSDRLKKETHTTYKKGYEIRFSVASAAELAHLRRWLRSLGLRPGRPYAKANRKIVPVYGKQAVDLIESALP